MDLPLNQSLTQPSPSRTDGKPAGNAGREAAGVPRVSVVMGAYNGEKALRSTVESILAQTYRDFEFIIVDDGSKDSTPEILRQLAELDSRIKVITQPNAGLTRALIQGCQAARGEFIARQDVGDVSLPDRFLRQVEFLDRNPDVVVVSCGVLQQATDGEAMGTLPLCTSADEATRLMREEGHAPVHTSTLFRRDAYLKCGGYREQFFCAQDHDLWHRMTRLGKLAYVPETLFVWRLDDTGISTRRQQLQRRLAEIARKCDEAARQQRSEAELLQQAEELRTWKGDGRQPSAAQTRAAANYHMASMLFDARDASCRKYLLRALRANPLHAKAWAKLIASVGLGVLSQRPAAE